MAQEDKVQFQLLTLFQDCTFEVDYSAEGRAGAAVVIMPHLKVLDKGSKGDGTFAWCTIETSVGPVSVGSVYAPNKRASDIALWEWLSNFTHTRSWLLMGDWNMVELHDDEVGPTAPLHGTEERKWKDLVDHLDLIDVYLTAVRRKGLVFTCQAICCARFDQSRLDRILSRNRGSWYGHIHCLEHDSRQTLSDHIPITATIILKEELDLGRRKGTYAKMDHTFLECEDFQASIQIEWDEAQAYYDRVDPRLVGRKHGNVSRDCFSRRRDEGKIGPTLSLM